jgi:hypothetical protein
MLNAASSVADKPWLWFFERLLPLVLVIVLPGALAVEVWLNQSDRRQREELIGTLNGLSPNYTVTIDSRSVSNPANVVEALKTITESQPHHSSPIDPRFVQIRSERRTIQLCLERDSELPTEYWVSTPRSGGCGEVSFGDPYFGVLRTVRLASYWERHQK